MESFLFLSFPVKFRLVGGLNRYSGRIEVYYNNTWGTICDDGFGAEEARVICGYFGYRSG